MKAHSTILCPTDFSEPARDGLDAAVVLAERIEAEILLVHVVPPVPLATVPQASPAFDMAGYQSELVKSAESWLKKTADENVPEDIKARSLVATGDPADEICRVADDENVSVIVMATHGQSGWKRFVFGSVAEKVVRCAACPILVVPEPDASRGDTTTFVRDWGKESVESEL